MTLLPEKRHGTRLHPTRPDLTGVHRHTAELPTY